MASLNSVHLIGNCGKDPETRYTQSGTAVTNVSIACNENWTDKDGEKQERVEWVTLVFWDKLAEIAGKYLEKGAQCFVQGRLQTRKWEDKEGNDRYTTEVVVDKLVLLGGKSDRSDRDDSEERQGSRRQSSASEPKTTTRTVKGKTVDDLADDIPF